MHNTDVCNFTMRFRADVTKTAFLKKLPFLLHTVFYLLLILLLLLYQGFVCVQGLKTVRYNRNWMTVVRIVEEEKVPYNNTLKHCIATDAR